MSQLALPKAGLNGVLGGSSLGQRGRSCEPEGSGMVRFVLLSSSITRPLQTSLFVQFLPGNAESSARSFPEEEGACRLGCPHARPLTSDRHGGVERALEGGPAPSVLPTHPWSSVAGPLGWLPTPHVPS